MRKKLDGQEDLICIKYQQGYSARKIAKQYNVCTETIMTVLRKNELTIRNNSERMKRYSCNDNYFLEINTPEKAYFYGWMLSDGYVGNNVIKLQLQEGDKKILEKFKQALFYTGPISHKKKATENRQNSSLLQIYSKNLAENLAKHGCIQRKSHKTYFPSISTDLYSHFIRGLFEGDGCVYEDKRSKSLVFRLMGNKPLLEKVQEILISNCKLNKTKFNHNKVHPNNIVTLAYYGNNNCDKIFSFIYKNCGDLYLSRKYEKVRENQRYREEKIS